MSDGTQLGALLVEGGLITNDQLAAALEVQGTSGKPIGRVLIDQGLISESDLVRALAKQVGLDFVDLTEHPIDATVASLIPEALARRYQALPIAWDGELLVVAMADPSNVLAVDDIRALTGAQVRSVVATAAQIRDAIDRFHRLDGEVDDLASQAADELGEGEDLSNVSAVVEDAPIVKFVNLLITQATSDRASDIHVESRDHEAVIKYRIDGVLQYAMPPIANAPRRWQILITCRL